MKAHALVLALVLAFSVVHASDQKEAAAPANHSDALSSEKRTGPSKPRGLPGIMIIEGSASEGTTQTLESVPAMSSEAIAFGLDGFEPGITRPIGELDAKKKLLRRFGQPSRQDMRKEPHKRDPTVRHVEVYTWQWKGLEIITRRSIGYEDYGKPIQYIESITLTSPKYILKFGLAIGAARAAFIEKLGRPSSEGPKAMSYWNEPYDPVVNIWFDEQDRVKKITWQYF